MITLGDRPMPHIIEPSNLRPGPNATHDLLARRWNKYICGQIYDAKVSQVTEVCVGIGPACLLYLLSKIGIILSERHQNKGRVTTIIHNITLIEKQDEDAAGGGAAYYNQHGALNSGFADQLDIQDIVACLDQQSGAGYPEFKALIQSLEVIANSHLSGSIEELKHEYYHVNQLGINLLKETYRDGKVNASKAPFLRTTVHKIFKSMFEKALEFVDEYVPEIKVTTLFSTGVTKATLLDLEVPQDGRLPKVRLDYHTLDSHENGYADADIVCLFTGTRMRSLVNTDAASRMVTGPANADRFRASLQEKGRVNNLGHVMTKTHHLVVGQALHGLDGLNVISTVMGANTIDHNRVEPCAADPKFFEKTRNTVTMLARSDGNIPPPRLTHSSVIPDHLSLSPLSSAHQHAFDLHEIDSFPVYARARDDWLAYSLGKHPRDLPSKETSGEQLKRYHSDIKADDRGEITYTGLKRIMSAARSFGSFPSRDPEQDERKVRALFPTSRRDRNQYYNERLTYVTSSDHLKNNSNAQTMQGEADVYSNLAAPPKAAVRLMAEHHEAGFLRFETGNSADIQAYGGHSIILNGKVYDGGHAPGIIISKLDPVMASLKHQLKKDDCGVIEYGPCRSLKRIDDTSIPIFDFGNNASGRSILDCEGKLSILGRKVQDITALFANATKGPNLALMTTSLARYIGVQRTTTLTSASRMTSSLIQNPLQAVYNTLPSKKTYEAELTTAKPYLKDGLDYFAYSIAILATHDLKRWREAYEAGKDRSTRRAHMKTWLQGGTKSESTAASSYLEECDEREFPEAKEWDMYFLKRLDVGRESMRGVWRDGLNAKTGSNDSSQTVIENSPSWSDMLAEETISGKAKMRRNYTKAPKRRARSRNSVRSLRISKTTSRTAALRARA